MDGFIVSGLLFSASILFYFFKKKNHWFSKIVFPIAILLIIPLDRLSGREIVLITAAAVISLFASFSKTGMQKQVSREQEYIPPIEENYSEEETEENDEKETEETQ
ncbi:MAG: hypothetical protein ABIA76_02845 [Candidatus Diapherotrites archaeon]